VTGLLAKVSNTTKVMYVDSEIIDINIKKFDKISIIFEIKSSRQATQVSDSIN